MGIEADRMGGVKSIVRIETNKQKDQTFPVNHTVLYSRQTDRQEENN